MKRSIKYTLFISSIFLISSCVSKSEKSSSLNSRLNNKEVQRNTILNDTVKELMKKPQKPLSPIDHIDHIRKKSIARKFNFETSLPPYFIDYIIQESLEKPEYKKYIKDRKFLRKLRNKVCLDNSVVIQDTLSGGRQCEIRITSGEFEPSAHTYSYDKKGNSLQEVDGKEVYGATYSKYPKIELKSLEIIIDGKTINTEIEKFNNLYEVSFCNFSDFRKIVEAYEDEECIYIYMYGGNAAGTYFSKLIFDSNGFVTSITADYMPLSTYSCFGSRFSGF